MEYLQSMVFEEKNHNFHLDDFFNFLQFYVRESGENFFLYQ